MSRGRWSNFCRPFGGNRQGLQLVRFYEELMYVVERTYCNA